MSTCLCACVLCHVRWSIWFGANKKRLQRQRQMRTTTAVQVSCPSPSSTRVLPTKRRRTGTTCSRDASHDRGMDNFLAISRTSPSESSTFWQGTLRQHGGQLHLVQPALPHGPAISDHHPTLHIIGIKAVRLADEMVQR